MLITGSCCRFDQPPRGEAAIRRRLQVDYGLKLQAAALQLVLRLRELRSKDA